MEETAAASKLKPLLLLPPLPYLRVLSRSTNEFRKSVATGDETSGSSDALRLYRSGRVLDPPLGSLSSLIINERRASHGDGDLDRRRSFALRSASRSKE